MPARASIRARLTASSISALVAIVGAVCFLQSRPQSHGVRLADDGWLGDLLGDRSVAAASRRSAGEELLVRDEADRAALFRIFGERLHDGYVYDPLLSYRRESDMDTWYELPEHPRAGWSLRTNSLGMRNDENPSKERPDVRILVTGDSHTEGSCWNDESFVALIGAASRAREPGLSVEALNAGTSGYAAYNYLGVLERYGKELAPDVFVVTLYGGNDFSGTIKFQRYFHKRPPWARGPYDDRHVPRTEGALPQEFKQLVYFLNNPDDVPIVNRTLRVLTDEWLRLCDELDIRLVCVYLPPPTRGQPRHFEDRAAAARAALGLARDYVDPSDVMADAWLAHLEDRDILHVDLRRAFGESAECYYWSQDSHINLRGHEAVAEELLPVVAAALEG